MTDSTTAKPIRRLPTKRPKVTFADEHVAGNCVPARKETAPKHYEPLRRRLVVVQSSFERSLETVYEDLPLDLEKVH